MVSSCEFCENPQNRQNPSTTVHPLITRNNGAPIRKSSIAKGLSPNVLVEFELYMSRTWTLVAIVLTGIGACFALWMLIYVLIKICDGTLSGHQTLGLLMLVGVMLMYLRYKSLKCYLYIFQSI